VLFTLPATFPSLAATGRSFFTPKKEPKNSPLKIFGTTVMPPFAIAKAFKATLLAGVRVAEVSVSLWDLLLKMFPSESSQARFGTTVVPPLRQIGAGFAIAKAFNAALLEGVRVAEVLVSLWELLPKMFPSEG